MSPPPTSSKGCTAAWPIKPSEGSSESPLRVALIILDEISFAPLDDTGTQLLFRLVAGAYERRSLAIGSTLAVRTMGPVPARADHRPQHP